MPPKLCREYDKIIVPLIALLILPACVPQAPRPEPVPALEPLSPAPVEPPSPAPDPFAVLDDAAARLAGPPPPADPPAPSIWPRLRAGFSFADCPADSPEAQWAAWYGARQEYMDRVFTRAAPWLPDIVNQIEARGLPIEFALLPVVESAFDPFATSYARAAGAWQFIPGTARRFGLEMYDGYDGRRDVPAATRAALDYLQALMAEFNGDWRLALAAYNSGERRVQRALAAYRGSAANPRPRDLKLPRETRGYAVKLHGLVCLVRAPAAHGLVLRDLPDRPAVAAAALDAPLDLVVAAALAGVDIADLYALNPALTRAATPRPRRADTPFQLYLPADRTADFQRALEALDPALWIRWRRLEVRPGDSLARIAAREGTTVSELMRANQLTRTLIHPGQELAIPVPGGNGAGLDGIVSAQAYAAMHKELERLQRRTLPAAAFSHTVRSGENLWTISRRYRVSTGDLARWNGIREGALIHPGQKLLVAQRAAAPGVKQNATAAPVPAVYKVRRGDSLWTIARRYRLKLGDLLNWNELDAGAVLRPGQILQLSGRGRG